MHDLTPQPQHLAILSRPVLQLELQCLSVSLYSALCIAQANGLRSPDMMGLWLQPSNTSTNIALGYNATIICADQASDEVTIAILPIEAILSYNNNANILVQVRHPSSCSAASPVCFCQLVIQRKAHAVSLLM